MSFMNDPYLKSIAATYRSISSGDLILSRDSDFLVTRETKCVYIAQREYATVDPSLVDVIGTDGQGGCVGVVIRNPKSGLISVSHMDLPRVIDNGLTQMLSSVIDQESDEILDVLYIIHYIHILRPFFFSCNSPFFTFVNAQV
ncbi:unnamed protein product [Cuscuta epithymum]|uniref:Uncharacterized protein n=1 Tax=Cuscuta epithymum TaxID=186058 RepID=A0AAV0FBJ2_9ASTE|nr:unnamed protein product [Cuscuta epithymum]